MKRAGRTPAFGRPGSIAEVRYLHIGGIEQWVLMRGESLANPPLIVLHGGPGMSETHFLRHCNAALEKAFTVVYWDQRGAGKSFDRSIPRSSMSAQQFVADLDQLVDFVRQRLGHAKVALFGHSWGSVLGVLYAARFPQKVSVYVGSAQIGNWPAAEAASYALALAEAERCGNAKALKALRGIGAPPYSAASVFVERTWLSRFDGYVRPGPMWQLARMFLGTPELSLVDVPNLVRGFRFSMDAMWDEVSRIDLTRSVPALAMPVFFFLGRRDHWVPPQTSVAYFDALRAPAKELVWFEQSGHEMFADEPARFNSSMVERVRPSAEGRALPSPR